MLRLVTRGNLVTPNLGLSYNPGHPGRLFVCVRARPELGGYRKE